MFYNLIFCCLSAYLAYADFQLVICFFGCACFVFAKTNKQIIKSTFSTRRERDSNPRYTFGVYTLSRRASSTTRAPLRKFLSCKTGANYKKFLYPVHLSGKITEFIVIYAIYTTIYLLKNHFFRAFVTICLTGIHRVSFMSNKSNALRVVIFATSISSFCQTSASFFTTNVR